jgi:hypothetical protein
MSASFMPRLMTITPELVESLIRNANERLVFVKAGFFEHEIDLLAERAKSGIRISVYMEDGEGAARLGFGDERGLDKVVELARQRWLELNTVQRARMAILIADEQALLFFPLALAWETSEVGAGFPNGLLSPATFVAPFFTRQPILREDSLFAALEPLSLPPELSAIIPKDAVPESVAEVVSSSGDAALKQVEAARVRLRENPAPDPTKLRQITTYRNLYKIVRLAEKNLNIKEKSLNLQPFNRLLGKTTERLKSSWRVFDAQEIEGIEAVQEYRQAIKDLKEEYLHDASRHGHLIKVERKVDFEKDVDAAVTKFRKAMGLGDDNKPLTSGELVVQLAASHASLHAYLLSQAPREQGFVNKLIKRSFWLNHDENGEIEDLLVDALHVFIKDGLKFPTAKDVLDKPRVVRDYFDVSSEMLADPDFEKLLKKHAVESVRSHHEGFEQVPKPSAQA